MQIKNKKGLEKTVLAAMIIAIVAGLLVFVLFMKFAGFLGGTAANEVLFNLCQGNVKIRDKFAAHRVVALFLCPENKADLVTIHADAWKKCDPDGEFNLKKTQNKKRCAAIQVAQLAKRCFDMYGSGALTLTVEESGKYGCFNIIIKNFGGLTINERELTGMMGLLGSTTGYCTGGPPNFNNNDCDASLISDGGCGFCGEQDNVYWVSDLSGGTNLICFDERGTQHDAVLVNDPGCPRGEKRAAPLAEEAEPEAGEKPAEIALG